MSVHTININVVGSPSMKATLPDGSAIELTEAQTLALLLRYVAEARRTDPHATKFDELGLYRCVAGAMQKALGPSLLFALFGSDDEPPGGDKTERHLELVFSADRKAA